MLISKISIKNPVFIAMLTIAVIVFGIMGYKSLGTDLFPSVDLPIVSIVAVYPGADSGTIENDVVKKIEDAVATLSDIKHIDGFAISNVGQVVITFEDNVDIDTAAQDIRGKLAGIQDMLPDDMETPLVEKVDLGAMPILSLVLRAPPGESLGKITKTADKYVKNRLQTVYGVGSVNMYGGREREIKVLLNPMKIKDFNIPAIALIQMLKGRFADIPAGTIKLNNNSEEIVIKSDSEAKTISEISETPLLSTRGNKLKVRDVATVEDSLEEEESASFIGMSPTISLQVLKQSGVNVVQMAHKVKDEIVKINRLLPEGYAIKIVSDNSPFIEKAIGSSTEDIFLGSILAVLIIFIFLRNIRASIIIAVALPTSIIGTFLFIKTMGYTLNYMTTLALSLSVGLLVDDAIVVIENIFRHVEMGKDRVRASIDATAEIGMAVIAVTLTIVAVFGPVVYMKGMIGQFFKEFGMTVSVAILISLLVSFTITPLMASIMLKEESQTFFLYRWVENFLKGLENLYAKSIEFVLHNWLTKLLTFVAAIGIFYYGIYLTGMTRQSFMDPVDQGEFDINIELPGESSLDLGKNVSNEISKKLATFEWHALTFTTIGGGAMKEKNKQAVRVRMTDMRHRTQTQFDAMDDVRNAFAYLKTKYGAKISVTEKSDVGGQDTSPIQVNIAGADYELIKRDATALRNFMINDGSFTDILNSDKGLRKEIRIKLNHDKMTDLGVTPVEAAMALRYLFSGEKVANFKEKGEIYDIKAYIDPGSQNLESIKNIPLKSSGRNLITVSDIANISYGNSDVIITRKGRNRMIKITSSLIKGADVGAEAAKLRKFAAKNFAKGNELTFSGEIEMMEDTQESMSEVLIIAIFLIYIILASQFNSFIHPFTIMSALPFAVTGAFASLYFLDMSLSLMSFIGLIMLMGLVVKNSILILDFALQKLQYGGVTIKDALVEAGKVRLRPILMTALATIFGMVPVAISTGEGAEMKHPMAWAVIGGMAFSTLVTLFIVPVVFSFFDMFTTAKLAAFFRKIVPAKS